MSADCVGSNSLPLTQDLLAQMLGTRRSSVTVAAGILQRAELIAHTRGETKIIDRHLLDETPCECYGTMLEQIMKWQGDQEQQMCATAHL
jgi:hypothetical protein